jgi:hypothetical protein
MHYVRKLCTVIDWLLFFFAGNTMRVRKEHTCAIREQEFQILAAKNTMKAQAYTTPKALNDIYHEVLTDFPEDIGTNLGYHSIVSTLKDARVRRYQKANCSPEELCAYLDSEDCLQEIKPVCQGTVRYVEDNGTKHFAVILASPNVLQMVGPHNVYLMCDATFRTAPRPFAQLFNLMVSYCGVCIPIMHICMTSKHNGLYEGVMRKVRSICPSLEPRIIKSDYELALMKALQTTFPNATLSGCYFHFAQAVFRAMMRPGNVL